MAKTDDFPMHVTPDDMVAYAREKVDDADLEIQHLEAQINEQQAIITKWKPIADSAPAV